jgi:hypothetical protein
MNANNLPDFSGKTVSFTLIDDGAGYDIDNPIFEEHGGRLFVIGTVPKGATNSGWTNGKTSAILWDRVSNFIVFDSAKDFKRSVDISDAHEDEKKFTD